MLNRMQAHNLTEGTAPILSKCKVMCPEGALLTGGGCAANDDQPPYGWCRLSGRTPPQPSAAAATAAAGAHIRDRGDRVGGAISPLIDDDTPLASAAVTQT